MRCINCFELLNTRNQKEVCPPCRSNQQVMISATNAKKKYMLTNDEIKNSKLLTDDETSDIDLFFCKISFMHAYGSKYLVNDIEELAEKIFIDIDDDNKRKQKYLKNIEHNNEKMESMECMRENIQVYLEENNIEPDEDTLSFIEEVIKRKYDTDPDEAVGIIKRKIKLDSLINEHGGSKFIKGAKKHGEYSAYIYGRRRSLRETFAKINKKFEGDNMLRMREKKIEKFVKENIDDSYFDFISNLSIYKKYLTHASCKTKFETICKQLLEHIKRKESLDIFIDNNISDEYIEFAHHLFIYRKYTTDLKCCDDLESIRTKITDCVVSKTAMDDRIKKITSKTGSWLDAARKNWNVNDIYHTYIRDGGNINTAMKDIKNVLIGYDEHRTNDIDKLINKIYIDGVDSKCCEDVKFDFLTGRINLSDANMKLIEIKNNLRK